MLRERRGRIPKDQAALFTMEFDAIDWKGTAAELAEVIKKLIPPRFPKENGRDGTGVPFEVADNVARETTSAGEVAARR